MADMFILSHVVPECKIDLEIFVKLAYFLAKVCSDRRIKYCPEIFDAFLSQCYNADVRLHATISCEFVNGDDSP